MATGSTEGAALHRLTPHRNDPASAWLDRAGRFRVGAIGVAAWALFVACLLTIWVAARAPTFEAPWGSLPINGHTYTYAYPPFSRIAMWPWRLSALVTVTVGLAVVNPLRRGILRMRNAQTLALVRAHAPAEALALDDWAALEREPDGRVVSLVGWLRGRAHLPQAVGGQRCVGLAVPCRQTYHAVLEMMHDFDLVDEHGREVPVLVQDARLLGAPNVFLDEAAVDSLKFPVATIPSRHAIAFRDGDPVLVVGFKKTVVDPGQRGLRQAPVCVAIGSSPPRPLLLFPLEAERRDVNPRSS
jgi:hypothetical protein